MGREVYHSMNAKERQRYYWKAYNTGHTNGYFKGFEAGVNYRIKPVKVDRFPGRFCLVCGDKLPKKKRASNSAYMRAVRSDKLYCSRKCSQWAYRKRVICKGDL